VFTSELVAGIWDQWFPAIFVPFTLHQSECHSRVSLLSDWKDLCMRVTWDAVKWNIRYSQLNCCVIISLMHYISVSLRRYTNLFIVIIIIITTQPFNGLFSRTTWVSRYQKGKTNLDFTEARDSEWQWHQLGHMHVCTSLQTDNHASTRPLCFLQAGCPSCCPTNSVKALLLLLLLQTFSQ